MKKTKNIYQMILLTLLLVSLVIQPIHVSAGLEESVSYLEGLSPDAWITQALVAAGETGAVTSHLNQVSGTLATDYAKTILALSAIGENSRTFGNIDYIAKLKTYFSTNQMGDSSLLNDDIWSILALSSIGETNSEEVSSAKQFILDNQNTDGGWSYAVGGDSDSNDTAAATIALIEAGVSASHGSITNAVSYLRSIQNDDGGFGWQSGSNSDSGSDSWVICALNKLGQDPSSWTKGNNTPITHLESLADTDGGYWWVEPGTSDYNNKVMTAYAVIALAGKSFPVAYYSNNSSEPETYSLRIEDELNTICESNISGTTVKEVIENGALVCGYTYVIEDTTYGPYLKQINDTIATGLNGWMYFVNNISPVSGIGDYVLESGDEVLVYYGEWGMFPTKLSVSDNYLDSGENLIITVEYFEEQAWHSLPEATIKGGNEEYTTNSSGQITLTLPNGNYSLFAEKEGYIRTAKENIIVGSGLGQTVGLYVEIDQTPEEPVVDGESFIFEVTPNELNFGKMAPGQSSSNQVTLSNPGTVPVSISANVVGDSIFTENLYIEQNIWFDFSVNLNSSESTQKEVSLKIPQDYVGSGAKTSELIFWATAQ